MSTEATQTSGAAASSTPSSASSSQATSINNTQQSNPGEAGAADQIAAAEQSGNISPVEAKELRKKLKLKVDGKEIEEEIDFNDDEALTRHLQKSKAFDTRTKEYTGFKSQVDQFFQEFQNDPEGVMERLGMDVDAIATNRLQRKVEEMQKSPEQLEKEKTTKELEKLRKEAGELRKAQEQAQMETLRNRQAAEIEHSISSALEKSKAKLPSDNPKVLALIAQNMLMAIENGYNDITVEDIIPMVERQWKEEIQGYFNSSSEDLIEELLGKQNMDRLRKRRIAKSKQSQQSVIPVSAQVLDTGTTKPKVDAEKPKKSYKSFFRE